MAICHHRPIESIDPRRAQRQHHRIGLAQSLRTLLDSTIHSLDSLLGVARCEITVKVERHPSLATKRQIISRIGTYRSQSFDRLRY